MYLKMHNKKQIGKRKSIEDIYLKGVSSTLEADQWLKTVARLRSTKKICKKGLYKFKTFEEADEWMENMISSSSQESLR